MHACMHACTYERRHKQTDYINLDCGCACHVVLVLSFLDGLCLCSCLDCCCVYLMLVLCWAVWDYCCYSQTTSHPTVRFELFLILR